MTASKNRQRGRANRPRVGNPVAKSPLLRKGGAHERSAGGKRQRNRQAIRDALDEWIWLENATSGDVDENGEQSSPFFLSGTGIVQWQSAQSGADVPSWKA